MIHFTPPPITGQSDLFMLFRHWNKRDVPDAGFMVDEKKDGWRAGYWRGRDGTARLWTKGGHEIYGVRHITHKLAIMARLAGEPIFLDGEFMVGNTLAATKSWCEAGHKFGGEAGTLYLFDCMPESDWRAGGCDAPLIERKARLQALHEAAEAEIALSWEWRAGTKGKEPDTPTVIIPHDWTMSAAGVMMLAKQAWALGGEGCVVKDPQSVYRRGRNDGWSKVKKEGVRMTLKADAK